MIKKRSESLSSLSEGQKASVQQSPNSGMYVYIYLTIIKHLGLSVLNNVLDKYI